MTNNQAAPQVPAPRPLPAAARSRIRSEVMRAAQTPPTARRRAPTLKVVGVAAATAAILVGGGAIAATHWPRHRPADPSSDVRRQKVPHVVRTVDQVPAPVVGRPYFDTVVPDRLLPNPGGVDYTCAHSAQADGFALQVSFPVFAPGEDRVTTEPGAGPTALPDGTPIGPMPELGATTDSEHEVQVWAKGRLVEVCSQGLTHDAPSAEFAEMAMHHGRFSKPHAYDAQHLTPESLALTEGFASDRVAWFAGGPATPDVTAIVYTLTAGAARQVETFEAQIVPEGWAVAIPGDQLEWAFYKAWLTGDLRASVKVSYDDGTHDAFELSGDNLNNGAPGR